MQKVITCLSLLGLLAILLAPAALAADQPQPEGWTMMGPRYGAGPGLGMGPSFEGWEGMKPEERKLYHQEWARFMMQTLELRQKMASKGVELDTLWAQPQPDKAKIQKVADELADLWAQLEKKRTAYLMQCRVDFGDRGWTCPLTGLGLGSWEK